MAELPRDIPGENLKAWLDRTPEEALDPGQPIIDPHHHLWDRRPRPDLGPDNRQHLRYLGDDLIEDIRGAGHNVVDTVFVECRAMYGEGDAPDRVVGETEFVQGVAAMAASGLYGEGVRCCGAIVGFADLTWDAGVVESVLRGHMAAGRNFRGIRHAHGWHASPEMPQSHHPTRGTEGLLGLASFRAGFSVLAKLGLTFDCWGYHGQLGEVAALARGLSRRHHHPQSHRRSDRDGSVCQRTRKAVRRVAFRHRRGRGVFERRGQGRRLRDGHLRLWLRGS